MKKVSLYVFTLSVVILFVSCQKKNRMADFKNINTIDTFYGWEINYDYVVKGDAYSGEQYVSLSKKNNRGPHYKILAKELKGLTKVNVDFAVRTHQEKAKCMCVFRVRRNKKDIYVTAYNIDKAYLIPKQWSVVQTFFDFSKVEMQPNDLVSVFFLYESGETIDLDDIIVEFK